jgi:hypothetical protein
VANRMTQAPLPVSPNNPCPMLRALVAAGYLPDGSADLSAIGDIAARLAGTETQPDRKTGFLTMLVASIANGLNPLTAIRNLLRGVRLDQLRGGPLDKQGVGSGVLDAQGRVNTANLDRLGEFASDKTDLSGTTERGLSADEITALMDANFARAGDQARSVDRKLMDAEFPVLLTMMGKEGTTGRYLSLAELRTLITDHRLPARVTARLDKARRA